MARIEKREGRYRLTTPDRNQDRFGEVLSFNYVEDIEKYFTVMHDDQYLQFKFHSDA